MNLLDLLLHLQYEYNNNCMEVFETELLMYIADNTFKGEIRKGFSDKYNGENKVGDLRPYLSSFRRKNR